MGGGGRHKKRARAGNSSRRYKPCWAFVIVNKTNRRFEFAYELPRSGISRSTAMVFSFELTPLPLCLASFAPRSLDSRGRYFPFETRTKNRCLLESQRLPKELPRQERTCAELTRKVFNPVRNGPGSYGQASTFCLN